MDQLDGRGARAFGEVPAVGVHDVDPGDDGRKHRSQSVARRAVGMEIDGNRKVLLQQAHQRGDAARRNQTRHVLDGDHVGAQCGHLASLVEEIGVGEDRFGGRFARQSGPETRFGVFRVHGVANRTVGDAAVLLDVFDGRFHVVDVVQGIEDPHDAQTAPDRVAAEAVDDFVRIGRVAEQVAAARKGREFRDIAHCLVDGFEARPRILVEITHHRVGDGAAPHLHRIEIGIFVERQAAVDLLLVHTRREGRLLAVTQRKVSDFEISRHFIISFKGSLARIHCYSNNKGNKPSRICNFFPGNFQEKRPGRFLSVKKTGNRTIIRPICRRAGTVPGREARRGICV